MAAKAPGSGLDQNRPQNLLRAHCAVELDRQPRAPARPPVRPAGGVIAMADAGMKLIKYDAMLVAIGRHRSENGSASMAPRDVLQTRRSAITRILVIRASGTSRPQILNAFEADGVAKPKRRGR
jgi:hypothetical protein